MIEVGLPEGDGVPELVRSFAACLASVTETPLDQVPLPHADLPGAFAHWRSWFAGRGQGLVAIAKPAAFNWPGYWLAVLGEPRRPESTAQDATAVLMFGTPAGVVLSPRTRNCSAVPPPTSPSQRATSSAASTQLPSPPRVPRCRR